MKSPVKHLEFLDHTRGVAILAVLLFHTVANIVGYDGLPWKGCLRDFSIPTYRLYFLPFSSIADAGVAIFFVVSGFCIHLSFQQQGQSWRGFFIRRFFRIYPAYLAALLFAILVTGSLLHLDFQDRDFRSAILTHVFLIHNLNPATLYAIAGSFWSLAVEAQLYLLYPLLLLLVAKLGWRKTMLGVAACELLIRGTDGLIQTFNFTHTLYGDLSWLFSFSPLGYWFSWAMGAFIADAYLKNQPPPFLKIMPIFWLALAFLSYFLKPLVAFQFLFFARATAAMLSRLIIGSHPGFSMPAFSLVLLKKIGLWSYSIYLLHQPLLNIFTTLLIWVVPVQYRHPTIGCLVLLATWLAIIPIGFLWYKFLEVPAIAAGKRFIQKLGIHNAPQVKPIAKH
jgi:peptidoglycan/LPS O-acetylase OafA/YrhL